MRTIEVTYLPDGTIKIGTKGYKGSECQKATRDLEREFGRVIKEQKTGEFYSDERQKAKVR